MRVLPAILTAGFLIAGAVAAYQVFGERDVIGKMIIASRPLEVVIISSGHKMIVNSRVFAVALCSVPLALLLLGAICGNIAFRKLEKSA
jgi:hypothetical protein